MAASRMVKNVAHTVMTRELAKDLQKFIFFMASGKFESVNPCAPISARGFEVISAFVLKTLMITSRKGKIKQMNRRV